MYPAAPEEDGASVKKQGPSSRQTALNLPRPEISVPGPVATLRRTSCQQPVDSRHMRAGITAVSQPCTACHSAVGIGFRLPLKARRDSSGIRISSLRGAETPAAGRKGKGASGKKQGPAALPQLLASASGQSRLRYCLSEARAMIARASELPKASRFQDATRELSAEATARALLFSECAVYPSSSINLSSAKE